MKKKSWKIMGVQWEVIGGQWKVSGRSWEVNEGFWEVRGRSFPKEGEVISKRGVGHFQKKWASLELKFSGKKKKQEQVSYRCSLPKAMSISWSEIFRKKEEKKEH